MSVTKRTPKISAQHTEHEVQNCFIEVPLQFIDLSYGSASSRFSAELPKKSPQSWSQWLQHFRVASSPGDSTSGWPARTSTAHARFSSRPSLRPWLGRTTDPYHMHLFPNKHQHTIGRFLHLNTHPQQYHNQQKKYGRPGPRFHLSRDDRSIRCIRRIFWVV